jgi:hypothetical protein
MSLHFLLRLRVIILDFCSKTPHNQNLGWRPERLCQVGFLESYFQVGLLRLDIMIKDITSMHILLLETQNPVMGVTMACRRLPEPLSG